MPWHPPRLAATPEQIEQAEQALGQRLPAGYREFLGLANGWQPGEVIAIGASDFEVNVYLLVLDAATQRPGGIAWFDHEEVDRYESFGDFPAAMVDYSARIAEKRQAHAAGGQGPGQVRAVGRTRDQGRRAKTFASKPLHQNRRIKTKAPGPKSEPGA